MRNAGARPLTELRSVAAIKSSLGSMGGQAMLVSVNTSAKFGAKRSMHTMRQYYNNIKKKLFERFELESKSGFGVDDQGRICCDSEVWAVFCAVSI